MGGRFVGRRRGEVDPYQALAGTFLAPLADAMSSAEDEDVRRQAVCGLANFADDKVRPMVSKLRNKETGRTVLVELLSFTKAPHDMLQRKDAVSGLSNLLRNRAVHAQLLEEKLLPTILRLSGGAVRAESIIGRARAGQQRALH